MMYFSEGADGYDDSSDFADRGWTLTNSTYITLQATGSPWGGKSIRFTSRSTGGMPNMMRVLPIALSGTLIRMAWWMKADAGFSGNEVGNAAGYFISLENSALTNIFDIGIGNFGELYFGRTETSRGASTNNIGLMRSRVVADGRWHHVEMELTLSTTTGTLKVWIDGDQDINLSNVDTVDGASNFSSFTQIRLGACRTNNTAQNLELDDIILWDDTGTSFTGRLPRLVHRISTLFPNNAGNSSGFTASTGSNYANVDESASDGDTTYNETAVQNTKDTHQFTNVGTIGNVLCVGSSVLARALAGTPQMASVARHSGTDYNASTTHTLTTSFAPYEHFWEINPGTSADWTDSEVNSAEFGYIKTDAGSDTVRITRQIVEVIHDNSLSEEIRVTRQFVEVLMDEGTPPASGGGVVSTIIVM